MRFTPLTSTTTGLAAVMPACSARATPTMSTKGTPTPRTRATTTSTRCPTWLTPGTITFTGPVAGTRPLPTATTPTTRTRATATPPTATTTTSTNGTRRLASPRTSQRSIMPAQEMADDMHSVAEHRLRRIDQRYTAGRRAIIELLVTAGHPVSIEDIAERLPSVPRSSAYRHLTDLQAAGLIRRVTANDEYTRFELAEDLTEHHHHLLCINCGKVTDVTLPAALEQQVTRAISQLADADGFQAHSHRLDVLGLCAACR